MAGFIPGREREKKKKPLARTHLCTQWKRLSTWHTIYRDLEKIKVMEFPLRNWYLDDDAFWTVHHAQSHSSKGACIWNGEELQGEPLITKHFQRKRTSEILRVREIETDRRKDREEARDKEQMEACWLQACFSPRWPADYTNALAYHLQCLKITTPIRDWERPLEVNYTAARGLTGHYLEGMVQKP